MYIAQPPLYRVAKGKEEFYAYDEKERDEYLERLGNGDGRGIVNVQRYKGLGEMNPRSALEHDDGSGATHAAYGRASRTRVMADRDLPDADGRRSRAAARCSSKRTRSS